MNIHDYFDYSEAPFIAEFLMRALRSLYSREPYKERIDITDGADRASILSEIHRVLLEQLIPSLETFPAEAPPPFDAKNLAHKLRCMSDDQKVEVYLTVQRLFWAEPGPSTSQHLYEAGFFGEPRSAKLKENLGE